MKKTFFLSTFLFLVLGLMFIANPKKTHATEIKSAAEINAELEGIVKELKEKKSFSSLEQIDNFNHLLKLSDRNIAFYKISKELNQQYKVNLYCDLINNQVKVLKKEKILSDKAGLLELIKKSEKDFSFFGITAAELETYEKNFFTAEVKKEVVALKMIKRFSSKNGAESFYEKVKKSGQKLDFFKITAQEIVLYQKNFNIYQANIDAEKAKNNILGLPDAKILPGNPK